MKEMPKQAEEEFVGIISHELKTPLAIIRESIAQILEGILGEINPEQREFLDMAVTGIDRLRRMIDDLSLMSKIESGKIKLRKIPVEPEALIRQAAEVYEQQAKQRGIEFRYLTAEGTGQFNVDTDRMILLYSHILDNALKFTKEGFVEIDVSSSDGHVVTVIKDSGMGIESEYAKQVFEKYKQFTTPVNGEDKGIGLGLPLAKALARLHGGDVSFESREGSGTTVTVRIPLHEKT